MDEDEDDAEDDEDFAVTGPLKKVSDPFRLLRRIVRSGRRPIRRFRRRRRSRRRG